MNFQYFFFDTYVGYFLQALPIALLVSLVYGLVRFRNDQNTPILTKVLSCTFVCYMTGLLCLVIGLDMMGIAWYRLLYHQDPGRTVRWFSGGIDLIPDFFNHITGEVVGNVLMFFPFGVLFPLAHKTTSWRHTVLAGVVTVALIEVLQPIVGRAFDLNDIILNTLGILISASAFYGIRRVLKK